MTEPTDHIYPAYCSWCGWFGMSDDCRQNCCPNCGERVRKDVGEAEIITGSASSIPRTGMQWPRYFSAMKGGKAPARRRF